MTVTATIPTPNRINNQVQGQFYPLQREELIALRKNRLINNVAFVHLALRYENPYCDRLIEIIPKEFAERWYLPESSIYEALGKLKRLGVLALKTGRVLLQWLSPNATTEEVQSVDTPDAGRAGFLHQRQNLLNQAHTKLSRGSNSVSLTFRVPLGS